MKGACFNIYIAYSKISAKTTYYLQYERAPFLFNYMPRNKLYFSGINVK